MARSGQLAGALLSLAMACSDGATTGRYGDPRTPGDVHSGDAMVGDPGGDVSGDAMVGDPSGDVTGDAVSGDPAGDAGDPTAGDPEVGDWSPGDPGGDTTPPDCGVGLCLRLTWDSSSGDLDLHLSRDDAAYCSYQSCYFGNCKETSVYRVEWDGLLGVTEGDPTLLDDGWGWGPETIVVTAPVDGTYVAGVYFQPSGNQAVDATLEVLADGVQLAAVDGRLSPDGFWEAVSISVDAGAPQSPAALDRTCAPGVWSCNDAVGTCP